MCTHKFVWYRLMIDVDVLFKMGGVWGMWVRVFGSLLRGRKMIRPCEATRTTYRSSKIIAVYRCVSLFSLESGQWMIIINMYKCVYLFQAMQVQVPASSHNLPQPLAARAQAKLICWGCPEVHAWEFESVGMTGCKVWVFEKIIKHDKGI